MSQEYLVQGGSGVLNNTPDPRKSCLYSKGSLILANGTDISDAVLAILEPPLEVTTDQIITKRFVDIAVDATLGDVNIFLPALLISNFYRIKKVNTSGGNVIIHADGTDLIDDSTLHTLVGSGRPSSSIKGFLTQWRIV